MQRAQLNLWMAVVALLVASAAAAGPPQTITVQGQNDESVDRQAVQNAIDAAQPGDTVELVGTFQLDGTAVRIGTSRLTVTGRALDNDGDGQVNEDWQDGVDNDFDGYLDEDDWDAVINGQAPPDGGSLWTTGSCENPSANIANRGLVFYGLTDVVRDVTIRDIKFTTLVRGVAFGPDHEVVTNLCSDMYVTGGSAEGIVVERNWFHNTVRGVQAFGAIKGIAIRNNLFTQPDFPQGVAVGGGHLGCLVCDPEQLSTFPMGEPEGVEVSGNTLQDRSIISFRSERSNIRDNVLERGYIAIVDDHQSRASENTLVGPVASLALVVVDSPKASVSGNEVVGAFIPLWGLGASPGARFSNNRAIGAEFAGLLLDDEATGFSAVNNEFIDSNGVDVFLWESTFENTVIATDFETTVADEGTNNNLLGTLAMVNNPGVPDEVRAELEALREELANKHQ